MHKMLTLMVLPPELEFLKCLFGANSRPIIVNSFERWLVQGVGIGRGGGCNSGVLGRVTSFLKNK